MIETGYVFDYMCIYNYLEKSHIIVSERGVNAEDESESGSESENEDEVGEKTSDNNEKITIDLDLGGRCPITGKKLLGCKWNAIKQEWDIDGIRRLIF